MTIKKVLNNGKTPVKIWTNDVEKEAEAQLDALSRLNILGPHVAVMPDVHAGHGSTIGSVIPTRKAIIPSAVGVDLSCGMIAAKLDLTSKDLPESLAKIRSEIEAAVPVGFNRYDEPTPEALPFVLKNAEVVKRLHDEHPTTTSMQKNAQNTWANQIGTLGGGNHFIEICLDTEDQVWLMLHSGSRGIGNVIGRYFMKKAQEELQARGELEKLPNKELAYLTQGTESFQDYWTYLTWAGMYAAENRNVMLARVLRVIRDQIGKGSIVDEAVNCHHNYVSLENHYGEELYITRKGAVSARSGQLGVIPGSMGAKSFVVRGLGSEESFCSCSHGAGRRMSRTKARKIISVEDLKNQTEGVECRKDKGVLDESPAAYKDIDEVMENQKDLVEVVAQLKQIVCVKG